MATAEMTGDEAFCRDMLPRVSRTFAACIGLLPPGLEYQVLLAYLLCRIADTIEDCPRLDGATKSGLLATFIDDLAGRSDGRGVATAFSQPMNDDETLTAATPRVLDQFRRLPRRAREATVPWVTEMCEGMAGYATGTPVGGGVRALESVADLERYCYYVAGTVGHLLTDLFQLHHRRLGRSHYRRLKARATSFGLGLQMTNIIKDVADDHDRGWSYVPQGLCHARGVPPGQLLDRDHQDGARRVMADLIGHARSHLTEALTYCQSLPRTAYRIRLFCLTPFFFAVRTLRLAAGDPRLLDPTHKVKIPRPEVYRIIRQAHLVAPANHLVERYFRRLCVAA